ncbi:MFS transporter [Clostridium ganghwense]|uniref:MFS transporter n=1 Tax=Clostridium ganghwense TaxID=312089 RepID=A0ABT4CQT7_9CLOT|nr:MFS transporter [Clostridium ganghwense]MCY6371412.1 MFS transporter [Clostridium ganghwense]
MKKLLKITVLSISFLIIMGGSGVSPALGNISEAFPTTRPTLIKMILTLPAIILIPFSVLAGKLTSVMKKRKILIIGLVTYIIGGLGGGVANSIYILLFFRGILGIGLGLIMPFSTSLIADFFVGEERTKMMGLSGAVANLGAMLSNLAAGWLATINWRYSFSIYFIAIVVLILIITALPEPHHIAGEDKGKQKHVITTEVYIIAFFGFLLNIAFYAVTTNISIFIRDENIGDSASAGFVMSFLTLAGFIGGIFLLRVFKFLKNFKVPVGIALMSMGFWGLKNSYNLVQVIASVFLIGFGFGVLKPLMLLKVTKIIPRKVNAFAISIVSSSFFLGKFMSPIFLSIIGRTFGNTAIRFRFYFLAICLIISSIVSLIFKSINKVI